MSDAVKRQIVIAAPIERVWGALSDVAQFNSWFGVELEQSFAPGQSSSGKVGAINSTPEDCGSLEVTIWIERMEAPHTFSCRWHPFAIDPAKDYSAEPMTLVEFTLEALDVGTCLTVRETGFEALPADRIEPAWRANDRGWGVQAERIKAYAEG